VSSSVDGIAERLPCPLAAPEFARGVRLLGGEVAGFGGFGPAQADLSQMVVSLDSVTSSPPTLPSYLWKGSNQVGKLQLSDH
jgi:hypothetical protein